MGEKGVRDEKLLMGDGDYGVMVLICGVCGGDLGLQRRREER